MITMTISLSFLLTVYPSLICTWQHCHLHIQWQRIAAIPALFQCRLLYSPAIQSESKYEKYLNSPIERSLLFYRRGAIKKTARKRIWFSITDLFWNTRRLTKRLACKQRYRWFFWFPSKLFLFGPNIMPCSFRFGFLW